MKRFLSKILALSIIVTLGIISTPMNSFADTLPNHKYVDFSSDRSTYFFRLEGGDNKTIFFDFFSPFDPTVKVKSYDPLVMYKLDNEYYMDDDNVLMMNIDDLKKLYDPYFDYEIKGDTLHIRHTVYDKLIIDGFSERSNTLEYTKKVWDLKINLEGDKKSLVYDYTEYLPTTGGRNKNEIVDTEINKEKSTTNNAVTFEQGKVEKTEEGIYLPIAQVMNIMGKVAKTEEGYLAIQQENLADVTKSVERSKDVDEVVIPSASNTWNPGAVEELDPEYTWADYMNDVSDGKRTTGWLWRSFYIPLGSNFKDGNGEEVTIEANRIVPFNKYVPTNYDKDETRLTYMLHGGTGNENTPTHRLTSREVNVDEYAQKYNYIIVSPNGWTQNPIWRENQALYSFEKSFEMVMNEYPVDEDKVFISGNSLGGRGTLELAMRFPERFKAMVASAPKIADKISGQTGLQISIEDTKYDLANIKDMPAMIVQGTADSTTSFKTQIGSSKSLGSISKAIVPKLNNITYVAVEQGNHSYAYASAMSAIFDFFEDTIKSDGNNATFNTLNLQEKSKIVYLDNEKNKLKQSTKVIDETTMISLNDLKDIYGDDFKVYSINSYDENQESSVDYYTIIYNNKSLNFTLDSTIYRKNLDRYKEDANIVKSGAQSDEDLLDNAPQFSVAPYEKNKEVFVPATEVLDALGLNVNISESSISWGLIATVVSIIVVIGFTIFKFKK